MKKKLGPDLWTFMRVAFRIWKWSQLDNRVHMVGMKGIKYRSVKE